MNINEKELADAVERLREGDDSGLLISRRDVILDMITDAKEMESIIESLISDCAGDAIKSSVVDLFDDTARQLLTEALRTHKEQKAGLM